MCPVNNVIPCVTSYYVKTERGILSLFYVNTARNNKPEADGALLLPLLRLASLPAGVLWGSFVMHSFLPHGRLLNRADFYVHQSQAVYGFL